MSKAIDLMRLAEADLKASELILNSFKGDSFCKCAKGKNHYTSVRGKFGLRFLGFWVCNSSLKQY